MKADIEVTYEYGIVKGKQGRVAPIIRNGKAHLPIQLQMEYTAIDGARIMRVFTRAMPVTTNRQTAENGGYHKMLIYFAVCDGYENVQQKFKLLNSWRTFSLLQAFLIVKM